MATIKLSTEGKLIDTLVNKMGCITISQAKEILTTTTPIKEHTADTIVTILATKQYVKILDKKYLVPFHNGKVSKKAIVCMWYIMSKLETLEEYNNIFNSSAPAYIFFMDKTFKSNELIYVSEKNLGIVDVIIKKYLESTDKEKTYSYNNIFIFDAGADEEKILEYFSDKDLKIPHSVVFIKYKDITQKPEICEYGND